MQDAQDIELVRLFSRDDSEAAFAELVRRHVNLVYSVALRFTHDTGDAEDVTQAVFVILARKAAKLGPKTTLTGWLYETTRFTAMKLLRTKTRQQVREQEAYLRSSLNEANPDEAWKQLAPALEEGMSTLSEKDRTLLALRFFENRSRAETAEILGIAESAAHKRVARAVEKLRGFFARRGIVLPAALLTAAISAHSVQAAPVALAHSVMAAAALQGAAISSPLLGLVHGTIKLIAYTKMKTAILTGATALFGIGLIAVSVYGALEKSHSPTIYEAAENGDLPTVRRLLEENPALALGRDESTSTALIAAGSGGHKDVAELLLTYKADVNAATRHGYVALHFAALNGRTELVAFLLAHQADVNAANVEGYTPLHFAAQNDHKETVKVLLAHKPRIDAKNRIGYTPLHWAAENGELEIVQLLLTAGADINAREARGFTPLHLVVGRPEHTKVAELLRRLGGQE